MSKKPTCVLTVDGDEVNAAIIAEAAKQIGSTAMNIHNCEVTLKKGRKTENNPNPSTHFEVAFYPERCAANDVVSAKPETGVISEAEVQAEAVEEVTETAAETEAPAQEQKKRLFQ